MRLPASRPGSARTNAPWWNDSPLPDRMLQHVTIELTAEQVDACVRFYELLGFLRVDPPESIAGRATWVERDGTQVHLMPVDEPAVPASGHHAVLLGADYGGVIERLRDAGFDPEPRKEHWG